MTIVRMQLHDINENVNVNTRNCMYLVANYVPTESVLCYKDYINGLATVANNRTIFYHITWDIHKYVSCLMLPNVMKSKLAVGRVIVGGFCR